MYTKISKFHMKIWYCRMCIYFYNIYFCICNYSQVFIIKWSNLFNEKETKLFAKYFKAVIILYHIIVLQTTIKNPLEYVKLSNANATLYFQYAIHIISDPHLKMKILNWLVLQWHAGVLTVWCAWYPSPSTLNARIFTWYFTLGPVEHNQ